jgi:hypothetical protein
MTRFGWLVLGVVIIVLLITAGVVVFIRSQPVVPSPIALATTTPPDISTQSIYTNGEAGFSIMYPSADVVSDSFSPWRAGAVATGTPLLVVTDPQGIIRIGESKDAKELKACGKMSPSETTGADIRIGSTTFKAFVHDDLGTDNQRRVTSYRTTHGGQCVAMESIQPLVNGTADMSTSLTSIISSFSFARP